MEAPDDARAIEAAIAIAVGLDLSADDATLLQKSNKLALRLLPCDVFARVAPVGREHAPFEVELAQRLAETESPVAALEPRVEPRGYERDSFEATLWTYYEPATPEISPAAYADALERLHAGMRKADVPTLNFTDRVDEAEQLVTSRDLTPELTDADREMLASTLRQLRRAICDHGAAEQLPHGEPHPGNVLGTPHGPLFVDLETCCRGPVEFARRSPNRSPSSDVGRDVARAGGLAPPPTDRSIRALVRPPSLTDLARCPSADRDRGAHGGSDEGATPDVHLQLRVRAGKGGGALGSLPPRASTADMTFGAGSIRLRTV